MKPILMRQWCSSNKSKPPAINVQKACLSRLFSFNEYHTSTNPKQKTILHCIHPIKGDGENGLIWITFYWIMYTEYYLSQHGLVYEIRVGGKRGVGTQRRLFADDPNRQRSCVDHLPLLFSSEYLTEVEYRFISNERTRINLYTSIQGKSTNPKGPRFFH